MAVESGSSAGDNQHLRQAEIGLLKKSVGYDGNAVIARYGPFIGQRHRADRQPRPAKHIDRSQRLYLFKPGNQKQEYRLHTSSGFNVFSAKIE
jgi:hypothetical protein